MKKYGAGVLDPEFLGSSAKRSARAGDGLTDTMMEDWRDQCPEEVKPGTV